ncbi:hypothetical protein ES288_A08G039500v1 [Gossypium darwinii]|uniref:Uncharacterized protein n=1 Tax=Gossypium darwinii TaxID=34276 RepID=A0A5D2FFX5_GOSDA|nr:hypothetical protein ES288_A08G039500v1 [Gossypium darwinii]
MPSFIGDGGLDLPHDGAKAKKGVERRSWRRGADMAWWSSARLGDEHDVRRLEANLAAVQWNPRVPENHLIFGPFRPIQFWV